MPFSVKFKNPNNLKPQAVAGLGVLTHGETYHVNDNEAERFERVSGVALDKVEAFEVSKIKNVDPTKSPRYRPTPVVKEDTEPQSTDSQEGDN